MRDEGSGMRDGDLRSPFAVSVAWSGAEDEVGHPLMMDRCVRVETHP
jgi:hypothetical protein